MPWPRAGRVCQTRRPCLNRVKNGSVRARAARPFYPQEQISLACPGMSVWCHKQPHALQETASLSVGSNRSYPQKRGLRESNLRILPQGAELLFQSGHFSGPVRNDCRIFGKEKTALLKIASGRTDSIHIIISILVSFD